MKLNVKIPRDNLSLDAIDAHLAGMSYGQYKAIHPMTKEANEHRLDQKKMTSKMPYEFICKNCGTTFRCKDARQKYCGPYCQNQRQRLLYHERKRKEKARNENESYA